MNLDHLRALLLGDRQEPVVVGHIYDPALVQVVRAANTHAVLLSQATVVKQAKRHPDIGFEEYCIMPDVLRFGMVAQEHAEQLIFCYEHHTEHRFRLVVKGTILGELFMTSFHRTAPRQTRAILDRADILRRHAWRYRQRPPPGREIASGYDRGVGSATYPHIALPQNPVSALGEHTTPETRYAVLRHAESPRPHDRSFHLIRAI